MDKLNSNSPISGNLALLNTLKKWGINSFFGITGGGLVHITKHLNPFKYLQQATDNKQKLLNLNEYAAGFAPIGYYLASGKIAVGIATTGAAIKLLSCGLTDAKLHNIPAIYLFALNPTTSLSFSPLQDVSKYGMNILPQLQAELGDSCLYVNDINKLEGQLQQAQQILLESRPVAIPFHPDILSQLIAIDVPKVPRKETYHEEDIQAFLKQFPEEAKSRRVIIFVCSEAAYCNKVSHLIDELSDLLGAPVVWSVNGANAVNPNNAYAYGYISFGGNDKALELWDSLNENDILIALGLDTGEYSLSLKKVTAHSVWHFTDYPKAYGNQAGSFQHFFSASYHQVKGNIACSLKSILPILKKFTLETRASPSHLTQLNLRVISQIVKASCVDLVAFYKALNRLWQPNSIGFDDVCLSYKDRQYVTQRPNPNIKFYSTHDGSAMGSGYGMGIGAKLANPSLNVFIFSGDGCWRFYGGTLADTAHLGIKLFIINNGDYGIIQQGYPIIIPEADPSRYHADLPRIDFIQAAKAQGWDAVKLKADLSNLEAIIQACYRDKERSLLVDVPVDSNQIIGINNRLKNLSYE